MNPSQSQMDRYRPNWLCGRAIGDCQGSIRSTIFPMTCPRSILRCASTTSLSGNASVLSGIVREPIMVYNRSPLHKAINARSLREGAQQDEQVEAVGISPALPGTEVIAATDIEHVRSILHRDFARSPISTKLLIRCRR